MNAHLSKITPNAVDLAKHMATKDLPRPVDGEQLVIPTFRLDHKAKLPRSMPLIAGKTVTEDEFAVCLNPQAGELYLLVESRDHRIIGFGQLADAWIKAVIGVASSDRPRILRELDAAMVAIDTARSVDLDGSPVTLDDAIDNASAAVSNIESALRLARTLRSTLEQRPRSAKLDPVIDVDVVD